MDDLVSSGGCPVGGNLNNMYIPYSEEQWRRDQENQQSTFIEHVAKIVQDPHLDKRCRPQPTPTPPAGGNIQEAPLISHYEKLVERLEKENNSYAKLVDRLEEQIESLTCKEVAVECCNREDFIKKTDSDLLFKQKMEDQHDARLELHALYAKLKEVTGLRYYWNRIDKRLGVDPNQVPF